MTASLLGIHDARVALGGRDVLRGINLQVSEGEVMIIVGPSGCGKSTLLRAIAGLQRLRSGHIQLDSETLSGDGIHLPPQHRHTGMVFQGLALFPHLTVKANVGFGLAGSSRAERERRVNEELVSVGLEGLGDRYPHQLSGGQQQRVAIARSLVMRPRLLLMDEPFSDLDSTTRAEVRVEVLRIIREHGVTAVIVSHDREDAYHLGDRIAVMDRGRIARVARADEVRMEWEAHPFST
ncbi:MAG: ABC transporter ATP-binding protein [Flavobacteriales bacterium]|nr:ABC transporter ATP-binding protein [Flavobacteriales bacterium]